MVLPINILPYEKFELYGGEALSSEELLAIIIGSGIKNNNAIEIAREIMKLGNNSNSLRFLQDISVNDLMKIKGIGKCKAIEIKATFEVAKRINYPIQDKQKIQSAKDVIDLISCELKFEKREFVKVVVLNNRNKVLKIRNVAIGGANYSVLEPKQILSDAVKMEASKIIIVHNHPSGDSTPSKQDVLFTKRMKIASEYLGIKLLDHIIIGDGTYESINI